MNVFAIVALPFLKLNDSTVMLYSISLHSAERGQLSVSDFEKGRDQGKNNCLGGDLRVPLVLWHFVSIKSFEMRN